MNQQNNQRGNALFYILIAVILMAALSFAVSSSMQGSGDNLSEERARVVAAEITDFGRILSEGVSRLRLDGCSLTQISFAHAQNTGYGNGSAPVDESCHIFSNNGALVPWPHFPDDAFDSNWESDPEYKKPIFTIKNQILEMGSSGALSDNYDLIMIIEGLKQNVCTEINTRLYKDSTITSVSDDIETKYDGTINTTGVFTFPAAFNGRRQSCYQDGSGADSGNYSYYYVISIR